MEMNESSKIKIMILTSSEALSLLMEAFSVQVVEWVTFLQTEVMATVVMCRVRNPVCTAKGAHGKERYING